ncbi:MAG: S-layer homology domain-containing protein [Bacillota bacterium]|jgi:hypothetical protein
MKKAVTIILVLVMALVSGTMTLAATPSGPAFSDIAGHEAEAELTLMAALGIMQGDTGLGGSVRPSDGIKRSEFAKMMVAGLGRSATAAGLAGLRPSFKDEIPTWAWGWVNAAQIMGLMRGDDKGNFRPNDPVTYAETLAVLIRMVRGHEQQLAPGMWPYNYVFYALDNGFVGPVDLSFPNLPATRGDVARMLYASMQINRLDKDGRPIADSALLAGRVYQGTLTAYGASSVTIGDRPLTLAAKYYTVGASHLEGLLFLSVSAVTDTAGNVICIAVAEDAKSYSGVFSALLDKNGDGVDDTLRFEDGKEIAFAGPLSVTLNKQGGFGEGDLAAGDACVVNLAANSNAAYVVAFRYDVAMDYLTGVVKSAGTTDTVISLKDGGDFAVPASAAVTINGATSNRDSLAAFDCVYLATKGAAGAEVIAVKAIRQVVQGTVKTTKTSWPGPIYSVTIERAGGGTVVYAWNIEELGAVLPSIGTAVKIGLNAAGELYVPIGFTSATPYALVLGYAVDGAGNRTVTLDSRGTATVYPTTVDFSTRVGEFGRATIDGATGTVTAFAGMAIQSSPTYKLLSVDAARGTMVLRNQTTSEIVFIDSADVTVYKETAGGATYIGIGGLKVGDVLVCDAGQMIWLLPLN